MENAFERGKRTRGARWKLLRFASVCVAVFFTGSASWMYSQFDTHTHTMTPTRRRGSRVNCSLSHSELLFDDIEFDAGFHPDQYQN